MRTRRGLHRVGSAAAALLVACAPVQDGGEAEGAANVTAPEALASSLELEVADGTVDLRLHVTNVSGEPIELRFPSGQRHDFVVERADGSEVWRWSSDMMFTQALGTETLQPGQTLRYAGTWQAGGAEGEFVAVGRVTASNHSIEQRAPFQLP